MVPANVSRLVSSQAVSSPSPGPCGPGWPAGPRAQGVSDTDDTDARPKPRCWRSRPFGRLQMSPSGVPWIYGTWDVVSRSRLWISSTHGCARDMRLINLDIHQCYFTYLFVFKGVQKKMLWPQSGSSFFWGCLLLRSLLTLTIWMFTFRPWSCTTATSESHLDHPALDHPLPLSLIHI